MDRDRDYWLVGESVLTSWLQRGAHAVGNTSPRKELRQNSGTGTSVSNGSPSFIEVSLNFLCVLPFDSRLAFYMLSFLDRYHSINVFLFYCFVSFK